MTLKLKTAVLLSGAWYVWNYNLKEIQTGCVLIKSPIMPKSSSHTRLELNEESTSNMHYIILTSVLLLAQI